MWLTPPPLSHSGSATVAWHLVFFDFVVFIAQTTDVVYTYKKKVTPVVCWSAEASSRVTSARSFVSKMDVSFGLCVSSIQGFTKLFDSEIAVTNPYTK